MFILFILLQIPRKIHTAIFEVTAAMAVAAAGHLLLSPGNCEQTKHVALRGSPTSVWDLDFLEERKCSPSPLFTPPKAPATISNRSNVTNAMSPPRVFYDFDDSRTRSILWKNVNERKDLPPHLLFQGDILEEKKDGTLILQV